MEEGFDSGREGEEGNGEAVDVAVRIGEHVASLEEEVGAGDGGEDCHSERNQF